MIGNILLLILVVGSALAATGLFLFGLVYLVRTFALKERLIELARALGLTRAEVNPVLVGEKEWEQQGVMNPGVVKIGDRTHLFYRALGNDGVSRIGYASSKDGVHFNERLPYPVFALGTIPDERTRLFASHTGLGESGGTWGGAGTEDPRAVVIGDRVYLSFSAFYGWDSLRIGVSSISVEDLEARRWKWTAPTYLSPEGQVHKNWVLFPQKINGKFAILHSLHTDSRDEVKVEYLDSLEREPATPIQSPYKGHKDEAFWDSTLRGAGPPPIRTKNGWLLLYHATDAREPSRYKIGALLLDLDDPTKVIARAPMPVLAPDARYENEGHKAGVVYACGATTDGDILRVYYGGADSVVCTAATSLSKLLKKLGPVHTPRAEHKPMFAVV